MKNLTFIVLFLISFISEGFAASSANSLLNLNQPEPIKEHINKLIIEIQLERIKDISDAIAATSTQDEITILGLLNERGTAYFFMGAFDEALNDFNFVVDRLFFQKERELLGTALWGRMLCHAFKNQCQETYDDAQIILTFFSDCSPCKELKKENVIPAAIFGQTPLFLPIAKFASPDEKISPHECKSRVSGTVNAMKTIALKINDTRIQWAVNFTIDQLATIASDCCEDSPEWTKCLGPIVDAWHFLKEIGIN